MEENLISVIVPVYKVEQYFEKCVDSIINQTYKNLEIILVDDGSPDNCGKICDEYAQKDNRIKVIHKLNGGLSSARNAGLDICKGEFIAFVDSDDWIEPQYVEIMLNKQKQYDCDFVCCSVMDVIEQTDKKIPNIPVDDDVVLQNENIIDSYYQKYKTILTVSWNKLYKRKLFEALRYPLGRIYEDTAIILNLLKECNSVCIINDVLYNYLKRDNSIMRAKLSEQKVQSIVNNCKDRVEFLLQNNLNQHLSKEIAYRFCDIGWAYRTCKDKQLKKYIKSNFKSLWKNYHKFTKLNSKATIKMYINALYITLF